MHNGVGVWYFTVERKMHMLSLIPPNGDMSDQDSVDSKTNQIITILWISPQLYRGF